MVAAAGARDVTGDSLSTTTTRHNNDLYDGAAPMAALVPMIALSTTATTYAAVWCLGRLPWSRYWLGID